ncbi:FAD-dependent thymidylate synthase [Natranaerobius thermophilus]|uniref:FAD-dependent thymidylate synthase n=1 Tax=Natranaerobius thermophilus (strain ATCC BAA-1301 / DSM 18059 / JW/NM-WN-LF) TaxID=457570 RepID=B2A4B8_NATTJ|nr:FAD-dependent thymidylate synthase [Natranaerobius thermophilus]ACB83772.1 thymidylate synthase, flavin-dependent [Natranaerobius thermophilus JW/NM-WN-LF]
MKVIDPQVLIPEKEMDEAKLKKIERYARVCYKSEDKMKGNYNQSLLEFLVEQGHESVIEHEKVTVMMIIDRGLSHEIVRHRLASYSQESTRYCNYQKDKFGNEITLIRPYFYSHRDKEYQLWESSCQEIEQKYFELLETGSTPQEARSILPNSLKTEIVVTFNMREWRHFFKLRCDKAAHPQARQIAIPVLKEFKNKFPVLFQDIDYDKSFDQEHYASVIYTDEMFQPLK